MRFSDVNEFSHFGIHVSDLKQSMEFYVDRLGLEVMAEWVVDEEPTRNVVGYSEAVLNMAVLRLPGTRAFMEVIEYQRVARHAVDPDHRNPGTCHICWYVEDLGEAWAALDAAGTVQVSTGVTEVTDGPMKGSKVIYCEDPDGIRVELREANTYLDSAPRDPDLRGSTAPAEEFSHLGVHVTDLDRSLEFYRDQLGLEVVARRHIDEGYARSIVGSPDASLDMAVLRLPGSQAYLEVIEYKNVDGTLIDPEQANPGTCHMCFYVADLDTTWARLEAFGTELVSTHVVDIPEGPMAGGKCIYLKDPDGIRVELLQGHTYLDSSPRDPSALQTTST